MRRCRRATLSRAAAPPVPFQVSTDLEWAPEDVERWLFRSTTAAASDSKRQQAKADAASNISFSGSSGDRDSYLLWANKERLKEKRRFAVLSGTAQSSRTAAAASISKQKQIDGQRPPCGLKAIGAPQAKANAFSHSSTSPVSRDTQAYVHPVASSGQGFPRQSARRDAVFPDL